MKRLLLGALALAAMAAPASAQSWSGCYIGGAAGLSAAKNDIDVPITDGVDSINLLSVDGLGTNGFAGGAQVGCDMQLGRFVIGAFGDYLFHDQDFSASILDGLAGVSYDIENQWSIGGRAGMLVTDSTLVYGLVAYTQADTSDLKWQIGPSSGALPLEELEGWTVGAGLETNLRDGWYLGAEYRYTKFDDISTNIASFGPVDINLDSETEMHTGLATLKYKFNSGGRSAVPLLK